MKPRDKSERQAFFSAKNKRRALVNNPSQRRRNREMGRALSAGTWKREEEE